MFQRALLGLFVGSTIFLTGCLGGGGGGGGAVATPPLEDLQYTQASARYATRLPITPNIASLGSGEADLFTVEPALPSGLELDPVTGEITGTPEAALEPTDFVVTASNDREAASTTISIEVVTIAIALGGPEADSVRAVAGLPDGAFLVAGTFRGDAKIGDQRVISDQGSIDIFLARFEGDGSVAWVKTAGGAGSDFPAGIAAFDDEGFVVTGSFSEVALFGAGEPNQSFVTSSGDTDVFIARYDRRGELDWVKSAGGRDTDRGRSIDTFSDGHSAVVGTFSQIATFGSGERNETTLRADDTNAFVGRFSETGELVWVKQASGGGVEELGSVTTTPKDAIVAAGLFTESVEIDGEAIKTTASQAGFIARLSGNGRLDWLQGATGKSGSDITNVDAVVALSDESVVIAGFVFGKMTLDGETIDGTFDAFFARLDSTGRVDFIEQVEGTSTLPRAATALADDSFVVAGSLIGTATFGPGEPEETTLDETGNEGDGFIARFRLDGTLVWAQGVHGQETENLLGLATVEKVRTILVGDFQGETTFGAGSTNETVLFSDLGSRDGFAVRYDENGDL